MKTLVYILILLLAVLHQDFWFWNDNALVFKFMPVGLAYHMVYSILCAVVWGLAVRYAWPSYVGQSDSETSKTQPPNG